MLKKQAKENSMENLDLKLPYTDLTLILDSMRHYLKYIEDLDEDSIDEDTLSDLLNDAESLKGVEANISKLFKDKFGAY
jgi:undecaprenyl pyrophosphate synthase